MEIRKETEVRQDEYTAPKLVFEGDLSEVTKGKLNQYS
jgi:hypothetical protein